LLYEEAINSLVHQIIRLVYPQKIILFGSAARAEMDKDSDIDLLVVINKDIHKRRTEQMLYQNIEAVKIPYDILVTTEKTLEKHKDNIGLIYKTILDEGKVIYEA